MLVVSKVFVIKLNKKYIFMAVQMSNCDRITVGETLKLISGSRRKPYKMYFVDTELYFIMIISVDIVYISATWSCVFYLFCLPDATTRSCG